MKIIIGLYPLFFAGVLVLVFGMLIYALTRSFAGRGRNSRAPVITALARVCGKRSQVNRSSGMSGDLTSMTAYFVTFEFESGDRMEMRVPVGDYGYMCEGDAGKLEFRGERFIGFRRVSA